MAEAKKQRKRLPPEERQSIILDFAAEIVAEEGVSAVSMERVAKAADVSKSLVYVYFQSTTELLQKLLRRELKRLRREQAHAANQARTYEEMVRGVTHAYLAYIKERGLIIHRLQNEPSVAQGTGNPTDFSRDDAVRFVAEIISDNFDIPMELAIPAAAISFGLPIAAGDYLDSKDADFRTIEDLTVTMIIGSTEALRESYMTMHKPLKRRHRAEWRDTEDSPDLEAG
ncbi:MAG: TetR/AcrR family transcriptional regulator [Hyphomicrobiales bacterium]|nr:TetR/AcrR family transcriptional regulator [Hyphomicrobiales bacterium]